MIWNLLKTVLFKLDPEEAHYASMRFFKFGLSIPFVSNWLKSSFKTDNSQKVELSGIRFCNKVGLAAGFDKDGKWLNELEVLGFGHVEVGTVTPIPQEGNPKPRLFRLVQDESIINRMGFNNEGADALAKRIKSFRKQNPNSSLVIGGNIGKNKTTEQEKAIDDYLYCFKVLFDCVNYFVINVSSPNTPGLRTLQDKKPLSELLSAVQMLNYSYPQPKAVFLKIAPDLSNEQLNDVLEVVTENKLTGLIATNTTISRPSSLQSAKYLISESGGLSGKILAERSQEILKYIRTANKDLILISVGGIMSGAEAAARINSGADLVQIYSGMIYRGPWLCKEIAETLISPREMNKD